MTRGSAGYVSSLDTLLPQVDVLSIHVPLTETTRHLIGASELARLKPTAVLVNTARGPVVDEDALVDALENGRLFGAGLDVFDHEPAVNPRLLAAPGAMLLPHIGQRDRDHQVADGPARLPGRTRDTGRCRTKQPRRHAASVARCARHEEPAGPPAPMAAVDRAPPRVGGARAERCDGVMLALGVTPDVGASTTTTSATTTTDTAASAQQAGLLASVDSALSAATAQRSVHYVQSASAGKQRVTIVADASSSEGRQVVTVHNGSSVGHITGELTGDKVYFRGDAYGLSSYLGMPTNLASKYKNRWIVFTKSSQGFAQSVKAFTIQGPLSVVKLTKGTLSAAGATTVDGQAVTAIAGRTTALSTGGKSGPQPCTWRAVGRPFQCASSAPERRARAAPKARWTSACGVSASWFPPRATPSPPPRSSDRPVVTGVTAPEGH